MATNWQIGNKIQNRWEIYKILGGPGRSGMGVVYVVYERFCSAISRQRAGSDDVLHKS